MKNSQEKLLNLATLCSSLDQDHTGKMDARLFLTLLDDTKIMEVASNEGIKRHVLQMRRNPASEQKIAYNQEISKLVQLLQTPKTENFASQAMPSRINFMTDFIVKDESPREKHNPVLFDLENFKPKRLAKNLRDKSLKTHQSHFGALRTSLNAFLKAPDRNISDVSMLAHNLVSQNYTYPIQYPDQMYSDIKNKTFEKNLKNFETLYKRPHEDTQFYERKTEEFPRYSTQVNSGKAGIGAPQGQQSRAALLDRIKQNQTSFLFKQQNQGFENQGSALRDLIGHHLGQKKQSALIRRQNDSKIRLTKPFTFKPKFGEYGSTLEVAAGKRLPRTSQQNLWTKKSAQTSKSSSFDPQIRDLLAEISKEASNFDTRKLVTVKRLLFEKSNGAMRVKATDQIHEQVRGIIKNERLFQHIFAYICKDNTVDIDRIRTLIARLEDSNCVSGKRKDSRYIYCGEEEAYQKDLSSKEKQNFFLLVEQLLNKFKSPLHAFQFFDKQGRGFIDWADWIRGMKLLGQDGLLASEALTIFDKFANEEHTLCLVEFNQLLTKSDALKRPRKSQSVANLSSRKSKIDDSDETKIKDLGLYLSLQKKDRDIRVRERNEHVQKGTSFGIKTDPGRDSSANLLYGNPYFATMGRFEKQSHLSRRFLRNATLTQTNMTSTPTKVRTLSGSYKKETRGQKMRSLLIKQKLNNSMFCDFQSSFKPVTPTRQYLTTSVGLSKKNERLCTLQTSKELWQQSLDRTKNRRK